MKNILILADKEDAHARIVTCALKMKGALAISMIAAVVHLEKQEERNDE